MYRIDNATVDATLDAATADGPNPGGFFTDGNPGLAVPATIVDAEWLNMIQEELANVIEDSDAGNTALSKASRTQLKSAIMAMIASGNKAVIISGATFEASVTDGEAVRWDNTNSRFDEAIADGTANDRAVGIADVTNSQVILYGETRASLLTGLTPGSRYYLDASTAGTITTTAPSDVVQVGLAKSATVFFVDIDYTGVATSNLTQGRRMFYVDAAALRPTVTGGGDPLDGTETTAGRPDAVGVAFDFALETAVQFHWVLPPSVDPATLSFIFHVAEADPAATQHVARLGIQAVAVSNDDTMDVVYGTAVEVTITLGTYEDHYRSSETTAITIAGTPADGDLIIFRVYRNHDHVDDVMDVRLLLQGIEIYANVVAGNDA